MRSAAFTDKVIAFSRTLRLRGKKERRNDTGRRGEKEAGREKKTFNEGRLRVTENYAKKSGEEKIRVEEAAEQGSVRKQGDVKKKVLLFWRGIFF